MKFIERGRMMMEIQAMGSPTGVRCDVIELDVRDARIISEQLDTQEGMERFRDWWQCQILTRFNQK